MGDQNRGNRLIFIGGAPRSGTTLVQNILDSHPDICGGPELLHIPDIIELRKKLHNSIEKEYINILCTHADVDEYICSLIEHLLLPLSDKYGCKLLSEKTPQNVLVLSELISLFPASRFIFVVRDPRAIVSSMIQVRKLGEKGGISLPQYFTTMGAIRYSMHCFREGFAAAEIAPEKVLIVVYERLVKDVKNETKKICNFLGIEWSSQMMIPGQLKHLGEKAITKDQIWYDTRRYYSNPETQHIDKWKTQLTLIQQLLITICYVGYEDLVKLGYDFSLNNLIQSKRILGLSCNIFPRLSEKIWRNMASFARKIKMSLIGRRILKFIRI